MNREEILEKLNRLFIDFFDDENIAVTDETVASDIDGWDSFEHINLMVAVQDEFDIEIPMGKIICLHNVGELVDIIFELINQ